MNTIVRKNGLIQTIDTVKATVAELAHQSGYIKIEHIQDAINNQLDSEYMPRKVVVRALATILERNQRLIRK